MKTIDIAVNKRRLSASCNPVITWNTGYVLNFSFDEEWEESKTLRIVNDKNETISELPFTGNSVEIPYITNTDYIKIGVYAGYIKSTTPLTISCEKSIMDSGETPAPPEDDVYVKIMKDIGELSAKVDDALLEEELDDAVNEALKTAKESGEFDGADGKDGVDGTNGVDGADGKDGVSCTHSWDGTVLTVTSASGTSSSDLKGEKGETGEAGTPGKDGTNGKDGENGIDGKDGVSCTHSWNGTTLTVTSASGSTSADLKGEKGEQGNKGDKGDKGDRGEPGANGKDGSNGNDGYTPKRGTDYWTEEDKAEIKAYVDEVILGGAW